MSKTVVVFGASGTIGEGMIKVVLDKGFRAVGVYRSQASVDKSKERLGNPPEDKYIPVVGTIDSETNAAALQKKVVDKVKEVTDVVVSAGILKQGGPLLQQTVDYLMESVGRDKLIPHFLAAKYFLPLVQDKEGTSLTFINGASALESFNVPNMGNMNIASATEHRLATVLYYELAEKPVRINEVLIGMYVVPWDKPAPNVVSNVEMGKALLGVIVNPAAKGQSMSVGPQDLEKLATEGKM